MCNAPVYPCPPFRQMHLSVEDDPDQDITSHIKTAHVFLDCAERVGEKVYVHCYAGVSRSATIVLSYMMKKHKSTLQTAFEELACVRTQIYPNDGFIDQLLAYQEQLVLLEKNRARLAAKRVASRLEEDVDAVKSTGDSIECGIRDNETLDHLIPCKISETYRQSPSMVPYEQLPDKQKESELYPTTDDFYDTSKQHEFLETRLLSMSLRSKGSPYSMLFN
eukprot:Filipodium_phascolosomae@DN4593_c0_g1_i1.p1